MLHRGSAVLLALLALPQYSVGTCDTGVDILFVLDGSNSVNDEDWQKLLTATGSVADEFSISCGDSGSHVGLIQFPSCANDLRANKLPLTCNKRQFSIALRELEYEQRKIWTQTGDAMELARLQLEAAPSSRERFVIVITDGVPCVPPAAHWEHDPAAGKCGSTHRRTASWPTTGGPDSTCVGCPMCAARDSANPEPEATQATKALDQAALMKANGVHVLTMAVGLTGEHAENFLIHLSGSANEHRAYENFDELVSEISQVATKVCPTASPSTAYPTSYTVPSRAPTDGYQPTKEPTYSHHQPTKEPTYKASPPAPTEPCTEPEKPFCSLAAQQAVQDLPATGWWCCGGCSEGTFVTGGPAMCKSNCGVNDHCRCTGGDGKCEGVRATGITEDPTDISLAKCEYGCQTLYWGCCKVPWERPTRSPSSFPTYSPSTTKPSAHPTNTPTSYPTDYPTDRPTAYPTDYPTDRPTAYPTDYPTDQPTNKPTEYPTDYPTDYPTQRPTEYPTDYPTDQPTNRPTAYPTEYPTDYPTNRPTEYPTEYPTDFPTDYPTDYPTNRPTVYPTDYPTDQPTDRPTAYPTDYPTDFPTEYPTDYPTKKPTEHPTDYPTDYPTNFPTDYPTKRPTTETPTEYPTDYPTQKPTEYPTDYPTQRPTTETPTEYPTDYPTQRPTEYPTDYPTQKPTEYPTDYPSQRPTEYPTNYPTYRPTTASPTGCLPNLDLVFVIDGSGSVSDLQWCVMLNATRDFAEQFKFGGCSDEKGMRMGLTQFPHCTEDTDAVQQELTCSKDEFMSHLAGNRGHELVVQKKGWTLTGEALKRTNAQFDYANGRDKLVVVITDGLPCLPPAENWDPAECGAQVRPPAYEKPACSSYENADPSPELSQALQAQEQAQEMMAKGVRMMTLSVGHFGPKGFDFMRSIASAGNVFHADTMDNAVQIVQEMQGTICGPTFCSTAAQEEAQAPAEGQWCCAACEQASDCAHEAEQMPCGLNAHRLGSNCGMNPIPPHCESCTVAQAALDGPPTWSPSSDTGSPSAKCPYGQTLYWGCCPAGRPATPAPTTQEPQEEHHCEDVEILFVLDGSGSLTDSMWSAMLDTTEQFAAHFEFGCTHGVQMGLIQFPNCTVDAHAVRQDLTCDKDDFLASLHGLRAGQKKGWTHTGDALQLANAQFHAHGSDRSKVVVIITDGVPCRPSPEFYDITDCHNPQRAALSDDLACSSKFANPVPEESQANKARTEADSLMAQGVRVLTLAVGEFGSLGEDFMADISSPDGVFVASTIADAVHEIGGMRMAICPEHHDEPHTEHEEEHEEELVVDPQGASAKRAQSH